MLVSIVQHELEKPEEEKVMKTLETIAAIKFPSP